MKRIAVAVVAPAVACATAVLAHEGVTNPAVLERMEQMVEIAENTEVLGEMAKGERPFEAQVARDAAAAIARHAAETPALFEARETDPNSEALPAIWQEFDRFEALSAELAEAARTAARIETREDLRPALAGIGQACRACHEEYRE